MKSTRLLNFILVILIACMLLSCSEKNERTVADDFLDAIVAQDFETAYTYVWPYDYNVLNENDFIQKYTAIFNAMGITDVKISDIYITQDSFGKFFKYVLTYVTKDYGSYTYDFEMKIKTAKGVDYIDWDQSLMFPSMEYEDKLYTKTLYPTRGEIFSSDGYIVAQNDYGLAVCLNASSVKNVFALTDGISTLINKSEEYIFEKFNNALLLNDNTQKNNIVVLSKFPKDHFNQEEIDQLLSYDGISIDTNNYVPIRTYPFKEAFAHIVGYTGAITEQYLQAHPNQGYNVDSKIGKTGLELAYEQELKGEYGFIIYISDKWGNQKEILFEKPLEQGNDLILTINAAQQIHAYETLKNDLVSHQSGVAIVMDASTGYVEAMASYPSFDNNIFNFAVSDETWSNLTDVSSKLPLLDRATKGLYPPGSLIKPFSIVAGLESGNISANSVFSQPINDNQWYPNIPNWNSPPITRAGSSSGWPVTLENAMIHSDNIYFAWAATETGSDAITEYFEKLGFEQSLPFDIPVNKSNIINDTQDWYARILADTGYGQGQLLVTPIHIASMFTAYANKTGNMMTPILVSQIKQNRGEKYVLVENREPVVYVEALSQQSYDTISPLLKKVVTLGTARRLDQEGICIAGKTGTAEIGSTKSNEIAWVTGYWCDGSYNRLGLVMVETRVGSGNTKFNIAKTILSSSFPDSKYLPEKTTVIEPLAP